MSSHLRAEDHPTTRVVPEPSQRSRAGRLPPPRGDPAAEHYSRPIFWRETPLPSAESSASHPVVTHAAMPAIHARAPAPPGLCGARARLCVRPRVLQLKLDAQGLRKEHRCRTGQTTPWEGKIWYKVASARYSMVQNGVTPPTPRKAKLFVFL